MSSEESRHVFLALLLIPAVDLEVPLLLGHDESVVERLDQSRLFELTSDFGHPADVDELAPLQLPASPGLGLLVL